MADAATTAWAARAHVIVVEVDRSTVTPIPGLIGDGELHLMTALTSHNEIGNPVLGSRG